MNRLFLTLSASVLLSAGLGSAALAAPASAPAASEARTVATLSQMPTDDADLQMWGVAPATPAKHVAHAPERAALARSAGPLHAFLERTTTLATSLEHDAERFIGVPYVFGGTSSSGFDCSGYTQHVFAMLGIALPRTADAQFYALRSARGGAAFGDLVFFQTYEPGPSHVGIYLGGGRFIHSSSHGVMISRLSDSYWASRYLGARRVSERLASR